MRKRTLVIGLLLAAGLAGAAIGQAGDEARCAWDISVVAYSGQDTHWTSPTPVEADFARYYARTDGLLQVAARVFGLWVPVREETFLRYGEAAGPLPAEGATLYEGHLAYSEDSLTVAADVRIAVDGDGYLHVDVENFTASTPLRITLAGTAKIRATRNVYGDLNGDLALDGADEALYAGFLAGSLPLPVAEALADLDTDGQAGLADLLQLALYLAGKAPAACTGWDFAP